MTQLSAAYDDSTSNSDNSPAKMAVPPSPTPGEAGPNVFISADYTLWTAREAGLAIAESTYYSTASTAPVEGKVFYPDWKLRSGFKVDLGVYLPHDNWDLKAEYTWFYNKGNHMKDLGVAAGQTLNTNWIDPLSGVQTIASAAAKWDNWFNRIDVTLGRSFFAGHYLAIRPFMGLLGAWDNQDLDIQYKTTTTQANPYTIDNDQKWWGVGIYSGTESTFTFMSDSSNQWSLFLNAGAALPWSKFDSKNTTKDDSGNTKASVGNDFYTVAPMIEATLGIRWETWWSDGSWKFLLQAGWEEQVWFNHNNFVVPGSDANSIGSGSYTMQGLTIKAAVAF